MTAKLPAPAEPMKNVAAGEVPPFAAGLATAMLAAPTAEMSTDVRAACSSVDETKAVVKAVPLNCTTDAGTKFVPGTVKLGGAPRVTAELGFKSEIVGPTTEKFAGTEEP